MSQPVPGAPSLEVRRLRKSFGETRALVDCSLTGEPGTVHSVLGENGSGKSTLVKILAGVLPPDGGEVRVAGAAVDRFSPPAAAARGVVGVFQEILIAPNRSVLGNVLLGLDPPWRWSAPADRRREMARTALGKLGWGAAADLEAAAASLPLPRQQLVVVARALVREPKVLILDEATSALDVADRQALFQVIRELVGRGALVVFISHRLDEVIDLSDTVTVLRAGASVASVPRAELSVGRLTGLLAAP